jgi:hypothetical protein
MDSLQTHAQFFCVLGAVVSSLRKKKKSKSIWFLVIRTAFWQPYGNF